MICETWVPSSAREMHVLGEIPGMRVGCVAERRGDEMR